MPSLDFSAILIALKNMDLPAAAGKVDRTFLDYSDEQEPNAMDTLGNLVDKLCIVNNKMFFNQQWLYDTRRESAEAFEAKWRGNMGDLHAMLKRCLDLNNQRARLMDEIDRRFHDVITGKLPADQLLAPQNKTY